METIIRTENLTKYYGKSRGIKGVNLDVKQGEIFGFIGPNGAGKSTTIRTLLGLIKPSSGSAEIFGKDITRFGPEIREEVGYLPSEVFYYDNMRVVDLLKYSASFYNKPKHDLEIRMRELAERLDLDLYKKINNLSYGNKKKVGIVQGLLHSPKLIILDEPTGGLDPLMQQTFFKMLQEENARGATVLFSSHILSEVQRLCDRVAIIRDGSIVATEHMKDLRQNSYLKCTVTVGAPVKRVDFEIAGIGKLEANGREISFLYRGDTNKLIKMLSRLDIRNILLEEPELDEIFMHYYQKAEK